MTPPAQRLKAFLVLSLLLNIFLVGGLGGGLYEWFAHHKPDEAAQPHGMRAAMLELPQPKRHQLRQLLRLTRVDSQPLIIEGRDARAEVAKQLHALTLDQAALDAALAKARDADVALRAKVDKTLADFAGTLTPDERMKLAAAMEHRPAAKGPGPASGNSNER